MVVKLAEKNPQKLRQIGISYDIANAKGTSELSHEQKKKKRGLKKKEDAEKKKKQIEEEARDKEDFEAWKKEEKAEYEAWKREKARNLRDSPKETTTDQIKEAKNEQDQAPAPGHTEKTEPDVSPPSTVQDIVTEDDAIEAHSKPEAQTNKASEDEQETQDATENSLLQKAEGQTAPPSMADGPGLSRPLYGGQTHSVYGDAPIPQKQQRQQSPSTPADNTPRPWNAVCVLGLRVYSQDPEISIKLIKPKDVEEGAILDVDGDTPAGATM